MKIKDSAIQANRVVPGAADARRGTVLALLGVLGFSFSLVATAAALTGLGAWTITGVRGVVAALIAGSALLVARRPLPAREDRPALVVVALGCAIGFPLLSSLALQTSTTAHSAVVIGTLPLATAATAALRTGRRPAPGFWVAAVAGAAVVVVFALAQSGGRPGLGDAYLALAVLVCAAGYAEGGRLAARLPGWEVIAWGVVLAAPVNLVVAMLALRVEPVHLTLASAGGLAYLAAISQFGGFVAWYRGMGLIGVERASQLQLAQPVLGIAWAILLLGEQPSPVVPVAAAAVLGCIVATQRAARAPRSVAAGIGRAGKGLRPVRSPSATPPTARR